MERLSSGPHRALLSHFPSGDKAVHGIRERNAKYQLRDSFYVRNILADIRGFMRAIKRPFGGTLPDEYKGCQLYYDQQKSILGNYKDLAAMN